MKIIGINGSPRRQNSRTGQLVNKVLESATDKGARIEFFDITKLKIKPCTACDRCHKTGYCIQKDDFGVTFDKIMAADGLVGKPGLYLPGNSPTKKLDRPPWKRYSLPAVSG